MADSEPKCPECGIEGIDFFGSRRSLQTSKSNEPWFFVIHCTSCGHVYAVIPKHVFAETRTRVVISETEET